MTTLYIVLTLAVVYRLRMATHDFIQIMIWIMISIFLIISFIISIQLFTFSIQLFTFPIQLFQSQYNFFQSLHHYYTTFYIFKIFQTKSQSKSYLKLHPIQSLCLLIHSWGKIRDYNRLIKIVIIIYH